MQPPSQPQSAVFGTARPVFLEDDPRYRHCCCGIKTAAIVIGILEILGCISSLINSVSNSIKGSADDSSTGVTVGSLAFNVVWVILWIIAIALMFKGLGVENHKFLIMHIVMQILTIALCVIGGITFIALGAIAGGEAGGIVLVLGIVLLIALAVESYFLWVIVRCYRYLKEKTFARGNSVTVANVGYTNYATTAPGYPNQPIVTPGYSNNYPGAISPPGYPNYPPPAGYANNYPPPAPGYANHAATAPVYQVEKA